MAICFEYYCFLRPRKEIRLLRISDIDFGRGMINVRFENAKTDGRWVNIPRQFLQLMREKYKLHTYPRHFYVIGKKGEPGTDCVSINNLSDRFVRFSRKLNMPETYKMYSWKHTGNIRADNAGIPTRETQFVHLQVTLRIINFPACLLNKFVGPHTVKLFGSEIHIAKQVLNFGNIAVRLRFAYLVLIHQKNSDFQFCHPRVIIPFGNGSPEA